MQAQKKPQRSQRSQRQDDLLCGLSVLRGFFRVHRAKSEMKQPTACVVARGAGLPATIAVSASNRSRCGRRRPFTSEIDEPIVDPAVIHDPSADDDRDFGGDGRAGELHERLLRIAHRVERTLVGVRGHVLADRPRILRRVRIDQPEHDALRSERIGDAADLRRIAIGDRAVGAGEEEDDGLGTGRSLQRVDRRSR